MHHTALQWKWRMMPDTSALQTEFGHLGNAYMIEPALFQLPLYLPASLGSGGCAWGSMQGTCSKHTSPVARQPQTKEREV